MITEVDESCIIGAIQVVRQNGCQRRGGVKKWYRKSVSLHLASYYFFESRLAASTSKFPK